MLKATRYLPLVVVGAALFATPACASGGFYPQRYPVVDRDDRAYFNRGVRDGRDAGVEDARRGRAYDLQRHREYRDNRRGDDRGDLRAYRQGFESGYDEGYRRYGGGVYGDPRRGGYPPVINGPRRQDPDYGNDRGRFASPAADSGYRDGFEAGQKAARNGDRYDPVREKRYREGDHDYNNRYGSRDQYKRDYRAAFEQGYEAGYRGTYRR